MEPAKLVPSQSWERVSEANDMEACKFLGLLPWVAASFIYQT